MKACLKMNFCFFILFIFSSSVWCQKNDLDYDQVVLDYVQDSTIGITALVTKNGRELYRKSFGIADRMSGKKVTLDNIFMIGSITKQFTATAILQLAQSGKLALTDDVRNYVSDFLPSGPPISIEQVMSHTAGIKNYAELSYWDEALSKMHFSTKNIVDIFKNEPLSFEPGSKFQYSNLGYVLLTHVIEQASGIGFDKYLENEIFKPLGMTSTTYGLGQKKLENQVPGYSRVDNQIVNAKLQDMRIPMGAGGMYSTIEDLSQWNRQLFEGVVISSDLLSKATSPYELSTGQAIEYGYGWKIGNVQVLRSIKHDGIINGFTSFVLYIPSEDIFVAMLSNCDCVEYMDIPTAKLAALALGNPYQKANNFNVVEDLTQYQGIYHSSDGDIKHVSLQNGQLMFHDKGGSKTPMLATDQHTFQLSENFTRISFKSDEGKLITSLTTYSLGLPKSWQKVSSDVVQLESIFVNQDIFQNYVGKYQVPGAFVFEVVQEGEKYYGQVGTDKHEILPYDINKFFALDMDARIIFDVNDKGLTDKLTLVQNRSIEAHKLN